jgi:hypothetical protein
MGEVKKVNWQPVETGGFGRCNIHYIFPATIPYTFRIDEVYPAPFASVEFELSRYRTLSLPKDWWKLGRAHGTPYLKSFCR